MRKIVALNLLFNILLIIILSSVSAQNDPLNKKITVSAQKKTLENVLENITQQTGIRFSYNSQTVNPNTIININAQNLTVKEILNKILPSTVSYKKVGEHIVFVLAESKMQKAELLQENSVSDNGTTADNCLMLKDTASLTQKEDMKSQIAGLMLAVATASAPVAAQDTVNKESVQELEIIEPKIELISQEIEIIVPKVELISTEIEGFELNKNIEDEVSLNNDSVPENSISDDECCLFFCRPFQLTLIYPLGTGWTKSAERCYRFSINILGGTTGQIKGLELGGLFNTNRYGVFGAQFAGLFNVTGSCCSEIFNRNAQFAGIFNFTKKGKSVQFAGVFNVGDTAHLQAGGIFNIAKNAGFQAAGVFNMAKCAGFQAAGIFNSSNEKAGAQFAGIFNQGCNVPFQAAGIGNIACKTGAQFAGIVNTAEQAPFQAAGIVNVAQESVCQMAGIVNITKKGRFQLGLINVRDTVDGVSIGLINIVKKGGILEAGVEAGEFVHTALTFRSGVQRLYSIISVGYNYTQNFLSVGYGLGTSINLVGNLGMNIELTSAAFTKWNWRENNIARRHIQLSPILNYQFFKHFKIYAGPTLNLLVQKAGRRIIPESYLKVPYSFIKSNKQNPTYDFWIGVKGGIKF